MSNVIRGKLLSGLRGVIMISATLSAIVFYGLSAQAQDKDATSPVSISGAEDQNIPADVAFAENMARSGIAFLTDQNISLDERKADFRDLLSRDFDMNTIGRFAIGVYWRRMSDDQKQKYLKSFEDYIINVYSRRFQEYKGQKLVFDPNPVAVNNDVMVNSTLYPETGDSIPISWRVRKKDNDYKIIDIVINGISMAITQRSDFSSTIQRGGGDVNVLLKRLNALNNKAARKPPNNDNVKPSTENQ